MLSEGKKDHFSFGYFLRNTSIPGQLLLSYFFQSRCLTLLILFGAEWCQFNRPFSKMAATDLNELKLN